MTIEWVEDIDSQCTIDAYKRSRRRLTQLDTSNYSENEKAHINAMISNVSYSISWLERGCRPDVFTGMEVNKRKCPTDQRSKSEMEIVMDVPRLSAYMNLGSRGDPEQTYIPHDKMVMIEQCLDILTPQQRDAFIMVKVNRFPYETAAEIMGLKRSSIQKHVERATAKIDAFITKYHYQLSLPITG